MVFLAFAAWAFLAGSYWLFMAAVVLLQFSSNFAQGPYQGYIPDLVPTRQVGIASGLLGAAQIAGSSAGPALAILFVVVLDFPRSLDLRGGRPDRADDHADHRVPRSATARAGDEAKTSPARLGSMGHGHPRRARLRLAARQPPLRAHGLTALLPFGVFFLENARAWRRRRGDRLQFPLVIRAVAALTTAVPGGRVSTRIGRKPVIFVGRRAGALSARADRHRAVIRPAAGRDRAAGRLPGVFLAVDWALMTDIIPKAESGRYMGISNIVTAGSGLLANASGALLAAGS